MRVRLVHGCSIEYSTIAFRDPKSPYLFPYTTLFRSKPAAASARPEIDAFIARARTLAPTLEAGQRTRAGDEGVDRSEEHTSELQSRQYLVCRLLLEKKNITNTRH